MRWKRCWRARPASLISSTCMCASRPACRDQSLAAIQLDERSMSAQNYHATAAEHSGNQCSLLQPGDMHSAQDLTGLPPRNTTGLYGQGTHQVDRRKFGHLGSQPRLHLRKLQGLPGGEGAEGRAMDYSTHSTGDKPPRSRGSTGNECSRGQISQQACPWSRKCAACSVSKSMHAHHSEGPLLRRRHLSPQLGLAPARVGLHNEEEVV